MSAVRRALIAALCTVTLTSSLMAAGRLKVPREDELDAAQKKLPARFDIHKKQRGADGRVQQAQAMAAAAGDKDMREPATQFVLLRDAAQQAAAGGDAALSFRICEMLAAQYDVDLLGMKISMLGASGSGALTDPQKANLLDSAMALAQQLVDAHRYGEVAQPVTVAEGALGNTDGETRNELLRLKALAEEYRKSATALDHAGRGQGSPEEKLVAGKFYLLAQQWDAAIPLLLTCSDKGWAEAADSYGRPAQSASAKFAAAGKWWSLAMPESGPLSRVVLEYAKGLYEQAIPELTGDELRVAQLRTARPLLANTREGRTVDLMPLINPTRDVVHGTASLHAGAIDLQGNPGLIEIPFTPPAEYDLEVQFTRPQGNHQVTIVLGAGKSNFGWVMGAEAQNTRPPFGFAAMNDLQSADRQPKLRNGKRNTTVIQVRKDGAKAYFNGELLAEWKSDFRGLQMGDVKPRVPGHLGLACIDRAVFFEARLVEVTGRGAAQR